MIGPMQATDTHDSSRRTLALAGVLLMLATMLGAFGTHVLRPLLTPQHFESFGLAVNYQFFNALGLLAIGLMQREANPPLLRWSVRLLLAGLLLFCGSIYALTAGLPKWFGMVAPLGGSALMAGWLCFAIAVWRRTSA
jgi:uncharacterized membrane protein YgdD (TMEM256/DUF423 family)